MTCFIALFIESESRENHVHGSFRSSSILSFNYSIIVLNESNSSSASKPDYCDLTDECFSGEFLFR